MTDDGGHPSIYVSNRQSEPVDEDALLILARATMLGEGLGSAELSVSLVEETEMEALHARFMGEPGPTDVLSFPMDEDVADEDEDDVRVLGDVVICPSVAATNDPGDPEAELRLLLVHGILHLLGYDHEREADRAEMWARQERYCGVKAP